MWLCSLSLSIAQFTLKGDLYVARKAQIHVAVPKTVFLSGTVVADRGTDGDNTVWCHLVLKALPSVPITTPTSTDL